MYNTYYFLFGLLFLAFTIQTGQLVFRFYPYVENILKGKKRFDPTKDRMRIVLSLLFYIAPLFSFFFSIKNSAYFGNDITMYFIILVISFGILFIVYATEKGLWGEEVRNIKKGRKNISEYKITALKYLLDEKLYKNESEYRKYNSKTEFSKSITSKNINIKGYKTLSNNITSLEKENLDSIFKKKQYKIYIPILLDDRFVKEKPLILDFLKKFDI